MARKCFYSFHFQPDCWRASQVRQIGAIEGNAPTSDNEWEAITSGTDKDAKICRWIAGQMSGRTCAIVLVGAHTAGRKWITYEIEKAWDDGLGVVGIRIHGLKNKDGDTAVKGGNPFDYVSRGGKRLSTVVPLYDPSGITSQERYAWIVRNLGAAVEKGIEARKNF